MFGSQVFFRISSLFTISSGIYFKKRVTRLVRKVFFLTWNYITIKLERKLRDVFSRIPQGYNKGMRYEERLDVFELQMLDKRRQRGDLVQFYKFDKNIDSINWLKPIKKMGATITTGPGSGLRGPSLRYCPEKNKK